MFARRPGAGRPHVILISIDTLRADHLGCYGHPDDITPNIDRLASEGIRFANAYTPVPLTLPGHATLMTGTTPVFNGVHRNDTHRLGEPMITLAELLKGEGYTTGAIVSSFVLHRQFGLDQGFDSYADEFGDPSLQGRAIERRGGATTALAEEWLAAHADDDAFFLFLHYYDPHADYAPPEPFATRWSDNPYAGEVAYVDDCLGRVFATLKSLNLYDDALIILVSDHGEMLEEHGEPTHGYFVYESAMRVPLIFKLPGQPRGNVVDDLAGLVDVVPTVCELLEMSGPPVVQGQTLPACLEDTGPQVEDRRLYFESTIPQEYDANPLLGVVGRRWKLIQTTRPELYDLAADKGEAQNLYASEAQRARLLEESLRLALEQTGGPAERDSRQLAASARARLESLGYLATARESSLVIDEDKADAKDLIDLHVRLMAAMTAIRLGGDIRPHIPGITDLAADRPNVLILRWVLAKLLAYSGDHASAVEHYQHVLDGWPDKAAVHADQGSAREGMGDLAGALADYGRAIALNPDEIKARMLRARLLAKGRQFRRALEDINHVIGLDPSVPGVWYMRGTVHLGLGKLQTARADLDEALGREPGHVGALMNRGGVRAKLGDPRGALRDWEAVIRLRPHATGAYVNVARLRHQMGDITGAKAALERCLAQLPAEQSADRQRVASLLQQLP